MTLSSYDLARIFKIVYQNLAYSELPQRFYSCCQSYPVIKCLPPIRWSAHFFSFASSVYLVFNGQKSAQKKVKKGKKAKRDSVDSVRVWASKALKASKGPCSYRLVRSILCLSLRSGLPSASTPRLLCTYFTSCQKSSVRQCTWLRTYNCGNLPSNLRSAEELTTRIVNEVHSKSRYLVNTIY